MISTIFFYRLILPCLSTDVIITLFQYLQKKFLKKIIIKTKKTEVIMKTLKLALVATVVAFALVSVASADGFKSKPKFTKRVNITIENAIKDPGLVAAMYAQLSKNDVGPTAMPPFIFDVTYNGAHYSISGTRSQWLSFFRTKGIFPYESKARWASTD
jgi:hypothetical protein